MNELIWVAHTDHPVVGAWWRAFRGQDAAQRAVNSRRHNGLVATYMIMMMCVEGEAPAGDRGVVRPPRAT